MGEIFDFEPFINYETIVCFSINDKSNIVNASCMGVHFTSDHYLYMYAYEGSHTREFLKPGKKFMINFSEDFTDYAMAAVNKGALDDESEIPGGRFVEKSEFPLLKSTWLSVKCEVVELGPDMLAHPSCKRQQTPNIRAKIISTTTHKPQKIINNRSFNLALEALILCTRIPLQEFYSEKFHRMIEKYNETRKIIERWQDMARFNDGFEIMDTYLLSKKVKAKLLDFY